MPPVAVATSPRPALSPKNKGSSRSFSNIFAGAASPGASPSELDRLREAIEKLVPLAGMEARTDARLDALENMLAIRLTKIETALGAMQRSISTQGGTRSKGVEAALASRGKGGLDNVALRVMESWGSSSGDPSVSPCTPGLEEGSFSGRLSSRGHAPPRPVTPPFLEEGSCSSCWAATTREPSAMSTAGTEGASSSSAPGAAATVETVEEAERTRLYKHYRTLVEADRDIKLQLKELRHQIRGSAAAGAAKGVDTAARGMRTTNRAPVAKR